LFGKNEKRNTYTFKGDHTMSRGLGKVQRMCLTVLTEQDRLLDSIDVAAEAVHRNLITEAEHVSFRRALNKLKVQGKVVDMGRGFRDGRRCWAVPKVAKRYFDRIEASFGKRMADQFRRKSRFLPEYYPDMFD
jgi:hypothetical protein